MHNLSGLSWKELILKCPLTVVAFAVIVLYLEYGTLDAKGINKKLKSGPFIVFL